MKKHYFLFLLGFVLFIVGCTQHTKNERCSVIPQPKSVQFEEGNFSLSEKESRGMESGAFLAATPALSRFHFKVEKELSPEAYRLSITSNHVEIASSTPTGRFYAIQTLLQLAKKEGHIYTLPCVRITDAPRFSYRGIHLDVSRHFFSKAFIKKQLDAMARYKMNRFHWHLTDGAGWRIEIKKYPLLTEKTAYRPYPNWKVFWKGDRHFCTADAEGAQGGFYTQEDVKEIVQYAKERFITVIPEIEMPGHSEEVFVAYPELSCSGKPYVNSDFCIGKEATFTFLQDVLKEVMALFPSKYIHIGGDEASKGAWKKCPLCQKRMQKEGLENVDELQSYLIHRIEKFLNKNGRKLLGWDEILEGGLAPDATVMSWRGEEGGIKAAQENHHVIMTPGAYCYLDHYQDNPMEEPEAIGGYTPLSKTYSYDPVPEILIKENKAQYVLGVQGNLWTEYCFTPQQAEYMLYPRLLAIAENGWSEVDRKEYASFKSIALEELDLLKAKGYHVFDLANESQSRKDSTSPMNHLAKGCKVTYTHPFADKYAAAGEKTLTDGYRGNWTYTDGKWQGFLNTDVEVMVDLKEALTFHTVEMEFMQASGAWVWLPVSVVYETSIDGLNFTPLAKIDHQISKKYDRLVIHPFTWQGETKARYVRCKAKSNGVKSGWLFTNEIMIK
jgi:hexosaminidase